MRDENGDYTLGQNGQNFYVNSTQAVEQAIQTTLGLWAGEYFLDLSQGVPWRTSVIGYGTQPTYDQVIRDAITSVPGVKSIDKYGSNLNPKTRVLTVAATVSTIYGSQFNLVALVPPQSLTQGGFGIGGYGLNPYGA